MHSLLGIAILWLLVGVVIGTFVNQKLTHWILAHAPLEIARGYFWSLAGIFRGRKDEPWRGKFRCAGKGCDAELCAICGSHFADSDPLEIDEPDQDHEVVDTGCYVEGCEATATHRCGVPHGEGLWGQFCGEHAKSDCCKPIETADG